MPNSRRRVFLSLLIVLSVLVGYVLSDAPAWALTRPKRVNSRTLRTLYRLTYAPLNWLARQSPMLDQSLTTMGMWWDRRLPSR